MRKSAVQLILFLILMLVGAFLFNPNVFAADYTVKSVIIIPPDWQGKIDKQELDDYKSGITNGLNTVRLLYSNLLNGKTFKFDRNIEVVASKDPIDKVEEKLMLDRDYRSSFNTNVFPERKGVVYIAWGIGTKNGSRRGDAVNKDFGFVWLKHQDILGLSGSGTDDERKWSLVMVAHELGHAFGLVFSGYADAHPCTTESPQDCTPNAPKPYPGMYEWASVMGYGTPYLAFPNLFFNNTIYNPEIQKILSSPFVNPNNDPAPSPTASLTGQKQQGPVFFELVPGTIIAGQNFAIKGVNLESFRQFEIRLKDLSNPGSKTLLQGVQLLDNNGSTIRMHVNEDAVPANSDTNWEIKLLGDKGSQLIVPIELEIKGKDSDQSIILAADISATCGSSNEPVPTAPIKLQTKSGSTVALANTQTDGTAILNYTIEDPKSSGGYNLVADSIQNITPSEISKPVSLPNPPQSFQVSANFHYPQCPKECNPQITFLCGGTSDAASFPKGHTIKITPNCSNTNLYGQGTLSKEDLGDRGECAEGIIVPNVVAVPDAATPHVSSRGASDLPITGQTNQGAPIIGPGPETFGSLAADAAPEEQIDEVQISNYIDFRPDNFKRDVGSPTITGVQPGSSVVWTLSTFDSSSPKTIYVRAIIGGQLQAYEPIQISNGETQEVTGLVKIKAQAVENYPTKITAGVRGTEEPLNLDNTDGLSRQLPGNEGKAQTFSVPYTIEFADGTVDRSVYEINYQPTKTCECPFSQTCTTADGQTGMQTCQGVKGAAPDGIGCGYDTTGGCNPQCDSNTCVAGATPLPTPTAIPEPSIVESTPIPNCGTPEFKYNECVGCNTSHSVYQDNCGNYTTGNAQSDANCASQCTATPPPAPNCGTPGFQYNQCIACNTSQPVYQDSCGNYTTGPDQSDGACGGPEWCAVTPPPAPNCGTPEFKYNECVGCNTSHPVYQDSCGNYTTGNNQSDGACTDGCNAPPPPPAGIPPTPDVAVNVGCIDGNNSSVFNISWGATNISYADISKADSFNSFYNKGVSGSTSADAPNGFSLYQVGTPLYIEPNTTYYFRIYDGTNHSGTASRTTPGACTNYSPPPSTGCEPNKNIRNECIGCNLSQGICSRGDCSEYLCIPSQNDGACANWCATSCSDDLRYCDTNAHQIIHKYGGVPDNSQPDGCRYVFDVEGPC